MANPTSRRIDGAVHLANKAGFFELIEEANKAVLEGKRLVSVVPMGGLLGAVYELKVRPEEKGNFFSETPEEDADSW